MNLARYLVSHTVRRWREQPWSPLARGAVAALLTGFALTSLAGLDAAEKVLNDKLEKAGANTAAILSPLAPGDAPVAPVLHAALKNDGATVAFVRLYRLAENDAGERLTVYAYGDDALPALRDMPAAASGAWLADKNSPEGLLTEIRLEDRTIPARATHTGLPARIPTDGASGVALVPFAAVADIVAASGGIEVTLFERRPAARPLSEVLAGVERMNTADRRRVTIVSAASLMEQIGALRAKKALVTAILSGGLVAVITLVFGALAALEYRENRFVLALLRSMGAPKPALAAQASAEALVVAFAAGGATFAALPALLRTLALKLKIVEIASALPDAIVSPAVVAPVALALLLGAFLATVPAVIGLRTPFGKVLE